MKFSVIQLLNFATEWRSHKLTDADLQSLEMVLMTLKWFESAL